MTIYFLHPQGSAWIAARFEDDELVDEAYEADAATHLAANDEWAGIVPSDDDVEVDKETADRVISEVLEGADPELVVVTRVIPSFSLEMRDGCSNETIDFGKERPDEFDIGKACETWIRGGDWGDDGAEIDVWWTLYQDGLEIDSGSHGVEIEPNHSVLITRAVGKWGEEAERSCGDDPDDHDWTSEGEGGLDSNPGVWATGGTTMLFCSHCRQCGLHRREVSRGSQKNPGDHDTVEYVMPSTWCSICEKEKCRHPVESGLVDYEECEGELINSYEFLSDAEEAAREVAHERGVRSPDKVVIAFDPDDDTYNVFVVS